MQLKPSPPMAQQLSAILADIAAQATHRQARSGLVTILHALILSALDRLIHCLQTAFALWQAGQLPAHAPPPAPRPRAIAPPHARTTPGIRRAPRHPRKAPSPATSPARATRDPINPDASHRGRQCVAPAMSRTPSQPVANRRPSPNSQLRLKMEKSRVPASLSHCKELRPKTS